jgi:carbamoyltransferase
VGGNLNLGIIGQAGKLMGLASWGQPRFFGREFVGNWVDFKRGRSAESDYRKDWFEHCLALAEGMGYDLSHLGDKEHMTAPINADIAASTQKLFEECISAAVEALYDTLSESGVRTLNLCMSGGTALNCPANSVVWQRGRFWNVFVEPGCDDSGIAIGAALALYHNVFDQPLPERTENYQMSPYLGQSISKDDILIALKQRENRLNIELQNDVSAIAKELASNKVVAWFDGRSEIGPRALGHRSIFADPRNEENWSRVNRIKGREMWRPLAPAVLEEESKKWFRGAPIPSPYMLFTASVKSSTVPSITHVDGSARVQTVNKSAGSFYALLQEFYKITGVPIILNTSFNGPGEPIVETPQEALAFFLNSECDLLWLEGYLVTRKVR